MRIIHFLFLFFLLGCDEESMIFTIKDDGPPSVSPTWEVSDFFHQWESDCFAIGSPHFRYFLSFDSENMNLSFCEYPSLISCQQKTNGIYGEGIHTITYSEDLKLESNSLGYHDLFSEKGTYFLAITLSSSDVFLWGAPHSKDVLYINDTGLKLSTGGVVDYDIIQSENLPFINEDLTAITPYTDIYEGRLFFNKVPQGLDPSDYGCTP